MEYFYSILCIGLVLLLNLFYFELKSSYLKQAVMEDKNKIRLSVVLDGFQNVLVFIIYVVIKAQQQHLKCQIAFRGQSRCGAFHTLG